MNIVKMVKESKRQHGLKFPWEIFKRAREYAVAKIMLGHRKFEFRGESYSYLIHLHNAAFRCERAVEVPVASSFIKDIPAEEILEVGNVLRNYISSAHTVVDKYEKSANVLNQDIVAFDGKFSRVVSISTFEHVGLDEEGEDDSKVRIAFEHVLELLNPGGSALIIVPVGYNAYLDDMLWRGDSVLGAVCFMKRISRYNEWAEASVEDVQTCRYEVRPPCATALAFCHITNPPMRDAM